MVALLSLWMEVFSAGELRALADPNQPPEGAKRFAEHHFLRIVEEVVFSDRPMEWGFQEEKGSITFSGLYPIYRLNADFALGRSDDIIADRQPTWVAVVFQDGEPVNAIGTQQTADGQFELASLGYPPELPDGLLNLRDGEIVIHEFPADEYYVYSEKTESLRKMELSDGTYVLGGPQSKEQFQHMLRERYQAGDKAAGRWMSAFPGSSGSFAVICLVVVIAALGGVWIYVRGRLRTKN